MMAHKHLHELLKEDQEPFYLENYIADRRSQLKRHNPRTTLQVKKRKPVTESSSIAASSKRSFCKHACFLSFHDSPDVRKSAFLDFHSPAKSPSKTQNGPVLLHVPARTAALLLEAAMRIQKQQQSSKSKSQIKNVGLGLFGSILKKLKDRNKNKNREIENTKSVNVAKSIIHGVKDEEKVVEEAKRSAYERSLSCSCNNSRLSSAGWSESNEEKSLDLESSSSCRSEDSLENAFACEKRFCSSPLSPFRFALQRSTSYGRRTPDFSSPAASRSRHNKKEKEKCEAEGLNNGIEAEDDEEKEQCSPVSVLDPLFEEGDDEGHDGVDEDEYEDDYDLECSYAIVQRAKQQLLDKLRRFEKLAGLDPVELEKRMMEEMDEADCEDQDNEESQADESLWLDRDDHLDTLVTEVLISQSSFHQPRKIPADMKKLVSDLLSEEKNRTSGFNNNGLVVGSICKKLNSWKEVQSNTIDMMVQLDFVKEYDGWKKHQEQVAEIAMEIELAVYRFLVEELAMELV